MNRAIIVILLCWSLTSCTPLVNELSDQYYASEYSDIPLFYSEEFKTITCLKDIPTWIEDHIDYKATMDVLSPEECLKGGFADCDGYSLLYMNIAYFRFGIKCYLIGTRLNKTVVKGGKANHGIIQLPSGQLIEPQSGKEVDYDICYRYSFDEVFQIMN